MLLIHDHDPGFLRIIFHSWTGVREIEITTQRFVISANNAVYRTRLLENDVTNYPTLRYTRLHRSNKSRKNGEENSPRATRNIFSSSPGNNPLEIRDRKVGQWIAWWAGRWQRGWRGAVFAVFSFWHAYHVPPGKRIPHKALYCAKLNTSAKYALKGTASLHAPFRLHAILRTAGRGTLFPSHRLLVIFSRVPRAVYDLRFSSDNVTIIFNSFNSYLSSI